MLSLSLMEKLLRYAFLSGKDIQEGFSRGSMQNSLPLRGARTRTFRGSGLGSDWERVACLLSRAPNLLLMGFALVRAVFLVSLGIVYCSNKGFGLRSGVSACLGAARACLRCLKVRIAFLLEGKADPNVAIGMGSRCTKC
jgi:hypothetical protein